MLRPTPGAHSRGVMGLATSQCGICGGAFEFDLQTFQETGRDGFRTLGQTVNCPHCNAETVVAIPISETPTVVLPAAAGSIPERWQPAARAKGDSIGNFISCPTCRERISAKAAACPKCGHVLDFVNRLSEAEALVHFEFVSRFTNEAGKLEIQEKAEACILYDIMLPLGGGFSRAIFPGLCRIFRASQEDCSRQLPGRVSRW